MDISAIPKLRFFIKKVQSKGFPGIKDKRAIPNLSSTSENLCTYIHMIDFSTHVLYIKHLSIALSLTLQSSLDLPVFNRSSDIKNSKFPWKNVTPNTKECKE